MYWSKCDITLGSYTDSLLVWFPASGNTASKRQWGWDYHFLALCMVAAGLEPRMLTLLFVCLLGMIRVWACHHEDERGEMHDTRRPDCMHVDCHLLGVYLLEVYACTTVHEILEHTQAHRTHMHWLFYSTKILVCKVHGLVSDDSVVQRTALLLPRQNSVPK